jgi:hypothetical protein
MTNNIVINKVLVLICTNAEVLAARRRDRPPVHDRSIYARAISPKIKGLSKSNIFFNYTTISLFSSLNSLFTGSPKLCASSWQVFDTVLYLLYNDFVLFLLNSFFNFLFKTKHFTL